MTTRSVDNYQNIENYNDVIDVLVQENAINNIPNSSNTIGGEIPVWDGSTFSLQGNTSLGIGLGAGVFGQGGNCVALGHNAGRHSQNTLGIAVGFSAGRTHQGTSAVAIGYLAGSLTQGQNAVAIGLNAGEIAQGNNSIALGYRAGTFTQGTNSIAIGFNAGLTSQPANSIVINSSGSTVSGITASSCYVAPIRNVITNGSTNSFLCYDDTNKEVVQASSIQYANPVSITQGSLSNLSLRFTGDDNTGFCSPVADNINIVTGGGDRVSISTTRMSLGFPLYIPNGSVSSPSLSFSGDSGNNTGLYRVSEDALGISTNGTLRMSVTTSAIACSLPLTLPTTGGTPTAFDYYEKTTQTMIMRYSNTQTFNWTITLIRIGDIIMYYFPDDGNLYTIGNGPRNIDSETNTIPSRFRPSSNQVFPYVYLTGGLAWTMGKIIINSVGSLSISPLNAQFQTNDTLYIQRQSNSVFI
jgi:hypothetical protein